MFVGVTLVLVLLSAVGPDRLEWISLEPLVYHLDLNREGRLANLWGGSFGHSSASSLWRNF